MTKPQLSVRSAKARDLAHRIARREQRTVAAIVERALEEYESHHSGQIPAREFYRALHDQCSTDIGLDAALQEHRQPHDGIEL